MTKMGLNATKVALARYAAKNPDGSPKETWDDITARVVKGVMSQGHFTHYNAMMSFIKERVFLPNTPCLVNAGFHNGQLAACFVLPVHDSIESIMDWTKVCALIHKSGGGTGMTFERLRPAGSPVKDGSRGVASGPVSFMGLVDKMTDIVKQGGVRRGANMGIMRVDHPDILRFIHAKNDQSSLLNYNISVTVTDDFMHCVIQNKPYQTVFNGERWTRPVFDPLTGQNYTKGLEDGWLDARDVWQRIIESAHRFAEPGVIFIDTVNRSNLLMNSMGPKLASNPCGEQMLHDNNACNLGSIDISKFMNEAGEFQSSSFGRAVRECVRFLDNVVDACSWPSEEISEVVERTRPVGLGLMGYADALIKKKMRYGSDQALDFAERVAGIFRREAWMASRQLAEEKGAMPEYSANKDAYDSMLNALGIKPGPVRNYEVTTIAPTGTISLVAETSSGIEPNFDYAYIRRDTISERQYVHPLAAAALGLEVDYNDPASMARAADRILASREALPDYFVDAHDVTAEEHVKTIAVFQQFIDNSISKTINASHGATVEDTARAHMLAYELGVKAVSYYRDGSRDNQVLTRGDANESGPEEPVDNAPGPQAARITRPIELIGHTWRIPIEGNNLYVTVNYPATDGTQQVLEVFANGPISPSVGFLASKMLRGGFTVDEVARSLSKIRGDHSIWFHNRNFSSPEQIVAHCLQMVGDRLNPHGALKPETGVKGKTCPECKGRNYDFINGCDLCRDCGYSKCK